VCIQSVADGHDGDGEGNGNVMVMVTVRVPKALTQVGWLAMSISISVRGSPLTVIDDTWGQSHA
jgi:hypothetical protein